MTYTEIPPWLYLSDLPDRDLQERYVAEAEKAWRRLVQERQAVEAELAAVRAAEGRALAFLRQARAALAAYQGAEDIERVGVPPVRERRSLLRPPRLLPPPEAR